MNFDSAGNILTVGPDAWTEKAGPSVNAVATATRAATPGIRHRISGVSWSFSAAPTAASIQVKDGATVLLELDVTAAGPGHFPFNPPLAATRGQAVSAVLSAGGAAVTGRIALVGISD
jgi:hypothetical protein